MHSAALAILQRAGGAAGAVALTQRYDQLAATERLVVEVEVCPASAGRSTLLRRDKQRKRMLNATADARADARPSLCKMREGRARAWQRLS